MATVIALPRSFRRLDSSTSPTSAEGELVDLPAPSEAARKVLDLFKDQNTRDKPVHHFLN